MSGRKEEGANEGKASNAGDNSLEEASKDTIKEKTNETTQGEDELSKVDNRGKDGTNDLGHCTNHTSVDPDGHRWGPLVVFSILNQYEYLKKEDGMKRGRVVYLGTGKGDGSEEEDKDGSVFHHLKDSCCCLCCN